MRRPGLTLSRLAQEAGLSVNKTFRLLGTLEAAQYVERDANKRYHPGARLLLVGDKAARQNVLVRAAAPVLDRLAADTGEGVGLAVRVGLTRTVVASRESPHPLRLAVATDDRFPLHSGALGRCLLAFAPDDVRREAERHLHETLSGLTPTTPAALRPFLDAIRRDGHEVAREPELGVFSVAAPILDAAGLAVAALNVSGPLARFGDAQADRYARLVLGAAREIARRLDPEAALAGRP